MRPDSEIKQNVENELQADPDIRSDDIAVVVATQGLGAEFLKKQAHERQIRNLKVLPWQPYEQLSDMLSSAEILTAIIEPEAGQFSVPSKVLSCFCAGRPVVAAMPSTNLAAQLVQRARAGVVVPPGDATAFMRAVDRLLDDPALADRLGEQGRRYAESHFDIGAIARRFKAIAAKGR